MDRTAGRDRETLADALGQRGAVPRPRLLIVNPNTDVRVTAFLAEEAARVAGQRFAIVAVNAASGLAAIETPEQAAEAGRAVEAAVVAGAGAAAAIIGAFGDSGLREARSRALMPVVGLGEAGMREAGRDGRKFSIVTLGAAMRKPILERARALGLGASLVEVSVLPIAISHAVENRAALGEAILEEIGRGPEIVLLGGAPFAGLAKKVAELSGRLVLDGVEAAVRAAIGESRQTAPRSKPIR